MRAFAAELLRGYRDERRTVDELRRAQARVLPSLVERARRTTPLYRALYGSMPLDTGAWRSLDDLQRVPVVPSETYRRASVADRMADDMERARCVRRVTSGSSGIPMEIWLTRREVERRVSIWYRSRWQAGLRPGMRQWTVGGFHARKISPWAAHWHRYLSVDEAVAAWSRGKPEVLHAYPSQMLVLLRRLQEAGLSGRGVRVLTTGGESLAAGMRRVLEDFFGAGVRDFYGSHETGVVARCCPSGRGYHVASREFLVEILRDGRPAKPGEEGEVVITSLLAEAMPIVRYNIGDYAIAGEATCPCGSPFQRIESFVGRSADVIRGPEGQILSAMFVNKPCFDMQGLLQYRVSETGLGEFLVEMVMATELREEAVDRVRRFYVGELGARSVVVRQVPLIAPDASGKHRRFVPRAGSHP